ncbi:putative ABC transporter permease, partial [Acinetobacter sp. 163]|nr:putative ABC transporter permease [Acinetobacter sp. 163]
AVWKKLKLDYNRDYSVYSLILLFFTFSFMGWVWEVLLHVYEDGMFVNRGVMHGPWLPIYGCGGVLVIVLLRKFADRTALTFA